MNEKFVYLNKPSGHHLLPSWKIIVELILKLSQFQETTTWWLETS